MNSSDNPPFPLPGGVLLGAGLASFAHSVLLSKVLGLHYAVSAWYPLDGIVNEKINGIWDGLFQVSSYLLISVGVIVLWRSSHNYDRWSYLCLAGCLLMGAGLFAVAEGLISHEFLKTHHVNERLPADEQFLWDIAYLGLGGFSLALGFVLLAACRLNRETDELAR
jgi:uncharacterized membrane protein